jgi:hypothetical protein
MFTCYPQKIDFSILLIAVKGQRHCRVVNVLELSQFSQDKGLPQHARNIFPLIAVRST